MQSENRMFDDLVKMVNGFAGTMAGVGREGGVTQGGGGGEPGRCGGGAGRRARSGGGGR